MLVSVPRPFPRCEVRTGRFRPSFVLFETRGEQSRVGVGVVGSGTGRVADPDVICETSRAGRRRALGGERNRQTERGCPKTGGVVRTPVRGLRRPSRLAGAGLAVNGTEAVA
jgi:hypothetical protein